MIYIQGAAAQPHTLFVPCSDDNRTTCWLLKRRRFAHPLELGPRGGPELARGRFRPKDVVGVSSG